jgi:hypothetical protein
MRNIYFITHPDEADMLGHFFPLVPRQRAPKVQRPHVASRQPRREHHSQGTDQPAHRQPPCWGSLTEALAWGRP